MAKPTKRKITKTSAKQTTTQRKAKALPEDGSQAGQRATSTTEVEVVTATAVEPESASAAHDEPAIESESAEAGVPEPTIEFAAPIEPTPAPEPAATVEPEVAAATTNASEPAPQVEATPKPTRTFAHDDRLPSVGTTIQKLDRHGNVRCECVVEQEGIRYAGTLFGSLSAAASAAAKQLGLHGFAQNGYVFFGLQKPKSRPATDPVDALTAAWERFHARASALVSAASDEDRAKLGAALAAHLDALAGLRTKAS